MRIALSYFSDRLTPIAVDPPRPAGLPLLLSCRGSLPPDPEGPDQKFRSETSKQTGRWVRDASRCWRDFGTKTTLQFLPFYIDEKKHRMTNFFCVHSFAFF